MSTEQLNPAPFARDPSPAEMREAGVTQRAHFETIRQTMKTERSSFESHWRELGEFFRPRRPRWTVTDRNKGDKRYNNIVDSTGTFALRTLQSGLHAGLTSPARPWMRLGVRTPGLAERSAVKDWLFTTTTRMLALFSQSNLYNALPVVYGDLGLFSTAAMGVMEDRKDFLRCYTYPIGSYAIGQDERGQTTTFMREYELSVRQIVEEFARQEDGKIDWSIPSDTVRNLYDNKQFEEGIEVVWIVMPNDNADANKLGAKYLPWLSVHYESGREGGAKGLGLLRESGFNEFPIMAPRWDVTGEDAYGTESPGMVALGDVKGLQVMQKRKAQAVEKQINPPLTGPSNLRTQKTSLLPGHITYADVREGMQGLRPIHETTSSIRELIEDVGEHQHRIRRAFYEDLFLMLAADGRRGRQPPTAREIDERHEEKLLALGPVLERTNDELLNPLIDRVFAMMLRKNLVPRPPEELEGEELKVEYLSLMAQAQKVVSVSQQDRFLGNVSAMAQVFPEVRHKVNIEKAVDRYQDLFGVDPDLVRPDDEAAERAQAEAQAIAEANRAAEMKDTAAATKDLSETNVEEDSALSRIVGSR
jgi:hypothetical protein